MCRSFMNRCRKNICINDLKCKPLLSIHVIKFLLSTLLSSGEENFESKAIVCYMLFSTKCCQIAAL